MSEECIYWIEGLCHRYPPKMCEGWCGWPLVKKDCICGEEKKKENKLNVIEKEVDDAMRDQAVTDMLQFMIDGPLSPVEKESRKWGKEKEEEKLDCDGLYPSQKKEINEIFKNKQLIKSMEGLEHPPSSQINKSNSHLLSEDEINVLLKGFYKNEGEVDQKKQETYPISKEESILILEKFGIQKSNEDKINEYRFNQLNRLIWSSIESFDGFLK